MIASTLKRPVSFWSFDGTADGASGHASKLPREHSNWLRGFAGGSATGTAQIGSPIQTIYEVHRDCSRRNWDGDNAEPVSIETARQAEKVLLALPSYLPIPDIFGEPSGAIAFEWYRRPKHRLVLSIYQSGLIEFAALLGLDDEVHGVARMRSDLPPVIGDYLRHLFTD